MAQLALPGEEQRMRTRLEFDLRSEIINCHILSRKLKDGFEYSMRNIREREKESDKPQRVYQTVQAHLKLISACLANVNHLCDEYIHFEEATNKNKEKE